MINKKTMMECVYNQLAIDYNCAPDDFQKDGLIFTEAIENEGRRPFPWLTPRLEMISMGSSVVINASPDILPFVRKQLKGKSRDEAFWMPFVYGIYPYFLPDIDKIVMLSKPEGFEYEMVEKHDICKLHKIKGFNYALHYDVDSPNPEMLVALARYNGGIVGMAGASAFLLYVLDNKVIGFSLLYQKETKGLSLLVPCKYAYLQDFVVSEEYRNRGYGTQLFEASKQWAKDNGMDYLRLSVFPSNDSGIRFYKRHGLMEQMLTMECPL